MQSLSEKGWDLSTSPLELVLSKVKMACLMYICRCSKWPASCTLLLLTYWWMALRAAMQRAQRGTRGQQGQQQKRRCQAVRVSKQSETAAGALHYGEISEQECIALQQVRQSRCTWQEVAVACLS